MVDINTHKTLVEILQPLSEALINAAYIEINFSEKAKKACDSLNIETEKIQDKLRLITSSIEPTIFSNLDELFNIKEITASSSFLIFDNDRVISYLDGKTYINFQQTDNYYLISNLKAYLEFQSFLKIQESETDDAFYFVDAYNKDLRKISFVSLAEKGRLNIIYDFKAPHFDTEIDYSKGFERFKACFNEENKSLAKFLKSSMINIASRFPAETQFKQLFESLNEIVDKARINFEVYLNNLSIDKIRKDYDEVKSKYFNSLSDILSKLSQKIIALPIGVSATLFAIDKVKDNPFFLYFLMGALLLTSIYISLLLRIHFKDLSYVSRVFHADYNSLLENNFFSKYPEEKTLFEEIKTRITDRIKFLKLLIESYFWVMNLANLVIIGFIFWLFGIKLMAIALISLPLIIIVTAVRNYVLERENNELEG
ncbi:MAG: hypothetical protein P1P88_07905 [Bacteroidales bacterium]|nr:hypothetical protein [Bacteroidales bacterium]